MKNKIKKLENELNKKNNEIQQLLIKNNNIKDNYEITSIKPGEKIIYGIKFCEYGKSRYYEL